MRGRNKLIAALVGLLCGTAGETLLFLETQCRRVEAALVGDFRVLGFTAPELSEAKAKVLEERLRALPGVRAVRFVSSDEALSALRDADPDLAGSVALLGENPLTSSFELELAPEAVSRAPDVAVAAGALPGMGDIRFKPLQVKAAVQAQFYARFLRLAISLAGFLWLAGAAFLLWSWLRLAEPAVAGLGGGAAAAAAGTGAGMALVLGAAYPLRALEGAWAWPPGSSQAGLVAVGALGALFVWGLPEPAPREEPRLLPPDPEPAEAEPPLPAAETEGALDALPEEERVPDKLQAVEGA